MNDKATGKKRVRNAAATREAIFAAARDLFGKRGFDAVGIRDIAHDAGVNAALVIRYFGGKEALFQEVVTEGFRFDALTEGDRNRFAEHLVRYTLQKESAGTISPLLLLLRSAGSENASAVLRDVLNTRFVEPLAAWLGGSDAPERAALIAAQMIGLAYARFVLRLDALAVADVEHLVTRVSPALQDLVAGRTAGAIRVH